MIAFGMSADDMKGELIYSRAQSLWEKKYEFSGCVRGFLGVGFYL